MKQLEINIFMKETSKFKSCFCKGKKALAHAFVHSETQESCSKLLRTEYRMGICSGLSSLMIGSTEH